MSRRSGVVGYRGSDGSGPTREGGRRGTPVRDLAKTKQGCVPSYDHVSGTNYIHTSYFIL